MKLFFFKILIIIIFYTLSSFSCDDNTENSQNEMINTIPPEGLLFSFEFNGNLFSNHGENINHTSQGGIMYTTDRFVSNHTIMLDGTEDTMLIFENSDAINIGFNNMSYSIVICYKTTTPFSIFTSAQLIEKRNGIGSEAYPFSLIVQDSNIVGVVYDGTTNNSIETSLNSNDSWTQVPFLYNADTQKTLLYTNASLTSELDVRTLRSIHNNANFYIGNSKNGIRPFSGGIDDIYIYEKALSTEEISQIFSPTNYDYTNVTSLSII